MRTPRQLIARNNHVAVSGLNVAIDTGASPVVCITRRVPFAQIHFMDMDLYQTGQSVGGIACLLVVCSAAASALSWIDMHIARQSGWQARKRTAPSPIKQSSDCHANGETSIELRRKLGSIEWAVEQPLIRGVEAAVHGIMLREKCFYRPQEPAK